MVLVSLSLLITILLLHYLIICYFHSCIYDINLCYSASNILHQLVKHMKALFLRYFKHLL